jgi:hypothetical protein
MGEVILGKPFIDELIAAGVVPARCTKVVIEAEVGSLTRMHYSVLGDDALVSVVPTAAASALVVWNDGETEA